MKKSPPIIGLLGGIGSGKSAVAFALKECGCIVADADANAKAVLHDPEVREQLIVWWGTKVLCTDGDIDRKAISDIVFHDEEARKQLEQLIHPRVRCMQEAQFAETEASTRGLVIDAPLLLEVGLDTLCDALIFVESSRELRLSRVSESRGWTLEELDRREDAQLPLDTKRNKADYVLINEGALDEVQFQVEQILGDIHIGRHI